MLEPLFTKLELYSVARALTKDCGLYNVVFTWKLNKRVDLNHVDSNMHRNCNIYLGCSAATECIFHFKEVPNKNQMRYLKYLWDSA